MEEANGGNATGSISLGFREKKRKEKKKRKKKRKRKKRQKKKKKKKRTRGLRSIYFSSGTERI